MKLPQTFRLSLLSLGLMRSHIAKYYIQRNPLEDLDEDAGDVCCSDGGCCWAGQLCVRDGCCYDNDDECDDGGCCPSGTYCVPKGCCPYGQVCDNGPGIITLSNPIPSGGTQFSANNEACSSHYHHHHHHTTSTWHNFNSPSPTASSGCSNDTISPGGATSAYTSLLDAPVTVASSVISTLVTSSPTLSSPIIYIPPSASNLPNWSFSTNSSTFPSPLVNTTSNDTETIIETGRFNLAIMLILYTTILQYLF